MQMQMQMQMLHSPVVSRVQPASTKGGIFNKRCLPLRSVRCRVLKDFIGGDLIWPDLGRWLDDVDEHKALDVYSPHEGGYEGRYLTQLRYQGYVFLDLSAHGLGDPKTTLTKIHPVCPPHLGRQPIARWYFPPEVNYRLDLLPPEAKGLVVWIIEAKVLPRWSCNFWHCFPVFGQKFKLLLNVATGENLFGDHLKKLQGFHRRKNRKQVQNMHEKIKSLKKRKKKRKSFST